MIRADSDECRILEQLLGERSGPVTARAAECGVTTNALWETLRVVPLVVPGLVRITGRPDAVALVMKNLVRLPSLHWYSRDARLLLFVVCQMLKVRGG